ncbi:VacB/RNase II family 3'-5' exoribonuclease [Candidatus Gracilibacteria bacterium]|nr:VacB/RNase II family 3'-5' exoribonuclease [Candidatus Gracilibacteria bacterium]
MTKEMIAGIYSQNPNNDFGFIDVPGEEKGYFVFFRNKGSAMDGDEVEAEVRTFKGRKEAIVERVTKRSEKLIIGKVSYPKNQNKPSGPGFVFVIPKSGGKDIFVPGKFTKKAEDGALVAVSVVAWEGRNPEGRVEAILGRGDDDVNLEGYILEAGFRTSFDDEVVGEAKNIKKGPDGNRQDLQNLFTFTIDGEDAKDLDDGISIKKRKNGNYELYVHIADVAEYVTPNSKLDKEAFKRATSVYLADRVLPMLPEQLSNDLCSLNLISAKKTLTCEMLIGPDGILKKTKVYESSILSDFRLTYKEVDELKKGTPEKELFCGKKSTPELMESLEIARELQAILSNKRNKNGMLHFDFKETKLILDENRKVVSISEYPKYDSNIMIEQFMISANEAVGQHFSEIPFLHRIHPQPNDDDIGALEKLLHLFGVKFNFTSKDSVDFARLLNHMNSLSQSELPEASKKVLEKMVLRTLTKAVYSDEREGHFGLGLDFYSHFTSPIRRYPDLQIHRIIKEKINGKLTSDRLSFYHNNLKKIADRCSVQERKAEKLEYKFRDHYVCDYYAHREGESFEGTISGLIPKGIFIELSDTAEGFVSFEDMVGVFYNQDFMRFEEKMDGDVKYYKLGDKISVKLIEIDQLRLRMNFEIV